MTVVASGTGTETAVEPVAQGTYLTDGRRLAWVKLVGKDGLTLELCGGLGPNYDPDDNPVLLRQTWGQYRRDRWRVVIPRGG